MRGKPRRKSGGTITAPRTPYKSGAEGSRGIDFCAICTYYKGIWHKEAAVPTSRSPLPPSHTGKPGKATPAPLRPRPVPQASKAPLIAAARHANLALYEAFKEAMRAGGTVRSQKDVLAAVNRLGDAQKALDEVLGVTWGEAEEAAESLTVENDNSGFIERAAALPDADLDEALAGGSISVSSTADLLGGASVLGQVVRDAAGLARVVQAGLPAVVVDRLRQAGLNGLEIESLVAPKRTLARRRKEGRLTVEESTAVERIARTLATAERVLGSRQAALGWLRRPMTTRFGGSAPLDYLHSDIGARVVEDTLLQAEYGLTA